MSRRVFLALIAILLVTRAFAAPPVWVDLPADNYAQLARFEDERFEVLNLLVAEYQALPKSDETALQPRIDALQTIADFLSSWVSDENVAYRKSFLANIKKIAEGKRWYLIELDNRCKRDCFGMQYLRNYHRDLSGMTTKYEPIFLVHQRLFDSNLGIYWGEFWYETIDPCHRQLTPYYDLWIKQARDPKNLSSFFLWLEDQNLSRDIPSLEYLNPAQLASCSVIVENGLLYLPSKGQKTLVDYCQEGEEYIFSIDLTGRLLLIPASKKIHHTSMSHGKPVLGSGNMTVCQGKITSIQLESGHYLPTTRHGIQILEIFNDLGIALDPNTPFSYYDSCGRHRVTVRDFQFAFGDKK